MKAISLLLCALLASVSTALPQRFNRDDSDQLASARPSTRPSFNASVADQPQSGRPEFNENDHNDNTFDVPARHDLDSDEQDNARPEVNFPGSGDAEFDDSGFSAPRFTSPDRSDSENSSPMPPSEPLTSPDTSRSPASGQGNGDDYPFKGQCAMIDQWSFNACQCTSFVAWRLNNAGRIAFNNRYKNNFWGNANNWDDAARSAGLIVDNNPSVGSVAQSDSGTVGHVAWVSKVDGDSVTIEEYNFKNSRAYHTRIVRKEKFKYIHFA